MAILTDKNRGRMLLDEIEVIRGLQHKITTMESEKRVWNAETGKDVFVAIENQIQLKEKLDATIMSLDRNRTKLWEYFSKKALSDLKDLEVSIVLPSERLLSQEEFSLLRGFLGQVRARICREVYKKLYVCLITNPMMILNEKEMPDFEVEVEGEVNVELWQGEYESAAFNIVNCSDEAMSFSISVSPLMTTL